MRMLHFKWIRDCRWALFLLASCLPWTVLSSCPKSTCTCKWKGGKQTVECINKGLSIIPHGLKSDTQVLDLGGSNLHSLESEEFQRKGLLNLQRIYLAHCQISTVNDRAFSGLTNLVDLDLSDNRLQTIPSGCFYYTTALTTLILSRNPIVEIQTRAFVNLKFLTNLKLSECRIEKIEDGAFLGLHNLQWLRLDGNLLKTLSPEVQLPVELHGIDLHNNPWNCDCHLQGLRNWLAKGNVPTSIQPRCRSPSKLSNQTLRHIAPRQLACAPRVTPSSMYLDAAQSENVSLECNGHGIPLPRVSWTFKAKPIRNMTTRMVPSTSHEDTSDVVLGSEHLYIIHESHGERELRSILSITSASAYDNGTFVCTAENDAGRDFANFTLRVVIPVVEPPEEIRKVLKWEDYIVIGAALACLTFALLVCICCGFCICRKSLSDRRKRKSRQRNNQAVQDQYEKANGRLPPNGAPAGDAFGVPHDPDVLYDTKFKEITQDNHEIYLERVDRDSIDGQPFSPPPPHPETRFDRRENISIYDPGKFCTIRKGVSLGVNRASGMDVVDYPMDFGLPHVSDRVKFAQSHMQHTRSFDDSNSLVSRQVQTISSTASEEPRSTMTSARTLPRGFGAAKRVVRFAATPTGTSAPPIRRHSKEGIAFVPLPPDEFSDNPPPPPSSSMVPSTSRAYPADHPPSGGRVGPAPPPKRVTIVLPRPEAIHESPDEGIVDCGPEGTEV